MGSFALDQDIALYNSNSTIIWVLTETESGWLRWDLLLVFNFVHLHSDSKTVAELMFKIWGYLTSLECKFVNFFAVKLENFVVFPVQF